MEIRCPACRKVNETDEIRACARCECDLSDLFRIARAAENQLLRSVVCLRQGLGSEAYEYATQSWTLKRSPESARLAFLAACHLGDAKRMKSWARAFLRLEAG